MTWLKRYAARFSQWLIRWADPSLEGAPLRHALMLADTHTIRAAADIAILRGRLDIAQRDLSSERLSRAAVEAALASMRVAEEQRIEIERMAKAEQDLLDLLALKQAEQRAADLESYRAYLYDLMPEVCRRAGLDASLIGPAWPLPTTGKLNDVLHHLGQLDQRGHPVSTLGDVIDLFVGRA